MSLNKKQVSQFEYIRIRRLAIIAFWETPYYNRFLFHFQLQEAVTRTFKEVYNLPSEKYRQMMKNIWIEGEEQAMSMTDSIKGWYLSGSLPELYDISIDTNVFHTGTKAGLLAVKSEESYSSLGRWRKVFKPGNLWGRV